MVNMKRRDFISSLSVGAGTVSAGFSDTNLKFLTEAGETAAIPAGADLVIAGGGLGGVAASIAALRNNLKVILIEETDWIGGQLTSQGVPPDEHPWIETHGAPLSYRQLRNGIRDYYKRNYPLTDEARNRPQLNPGDGAVSRLCHEPKVALAVMLEMLAPYISTGKLTILTEHKPIEAKVSGNTISTLTVKNLRTGSLKKISAPYFVDATETGDLLPLTGTEYVTGTESRTQTGELHAPDKADPLNNQSFTICFAMDHVQGQDHVIDKPLDYNAWKQYVPALKPAWPGKLLSLTYTHPSSLQPKTLGFHPDGIATGETLNLWNYRRIISRQNFIKGVYDGDISVVNWPQNDYMRGNIIGVSDKEFQEHILRAKQLSLSLLYWLQTEVPRPDGGKGWRGLRLRGDIMGTQDGLAKYPYVRESRRIKARFTILEKHVGKEQSGGKAAYFPDSVGIGYYHIDLHPSNRGVNYVDFPSVPFQIPLGALLPVRMQNLLPANKNIGTTHLTNGCYRLHPVEWSIGEAVGCLIAFSKEKNVPPSDVRDNKQLLSAFQHFIREQGIETDWPPVN
jgi:hypothetical protein